MTTNQKLLAVWQELDTAYFKTCRAAVKEKLSLADARQIKTSLQRALSLMQGIENNARGVEEPPIGGD